jgi:antiviral helicase SKI2
LQDAHGKFQDTTYRSAIKVKDTYRKQQVSVPRKHVLNSLMAHLRDQEMIPAIAFVFSRKQVETCAHDITVNLLEDDSKVPYIARRECEQIVRKLPNYEEYLRLPEYESLVKLLEKGIGIHHAGMLPILREIVELFISKRYVKLLCCTETFAIGLDCPIRTAIFTNIYKYTNDGGSSVPRLLHAHEYSQASGRAGRRGLDKFGYVVHCANLFDIPTATEYRSMMSGTPPTLSSKFKINYSWILNLIRSLHFVPGFTPQGYRCSMKNYKPPSVAKKFVSHIRNIDWRHNNTYVIH